MKKTILLFTLAICSTATYSQFIYKIKPDSLLVTNDSCTAEFNLENSAKNVQEFSNSYYIAWVSGANTITVRFNNYSTASIDPARASFRVTITRY